MKYDKESGKCRKLPQRPLKCTSIKDNNNDNKYTFRVLSMFQTLSYMHI